MKKLFFPLLATLTLLAACTHYDYTVSGDAVNTNINDLQLYLANRDSDGRQYNSFDSATVRDGKFHFKGNIDSARIVYLVGSYQNGEQFHHAFVLEKGKILVTVDSSNVRFAGTAENENLQKYADEKNALYADYYSFTATHDTNFTAEQQAAFTEQLHRFDEIDAQQDLNFTYKHINTVAGTHVFTSSAYFYMGIAARDSIFAQMNTRTKSIPDVKRIMENTEILRRTTQGQPFTDFAFQTPEGNKLALSDLVGKTDYVLVDFWASWCGPCIRSFPEVKAMYKKYKGAKLEILGVSLDSDRQAWINAIAQYKLDWKHVSDIKYWNCEAAKIYGVNAIPSTILIDREGKIAGRNLNMKDIEKLLLKKH